MTAEFTNPASAGLVAGIFLWIAQLIWNRIMGGKDDKSLPVQLTEISSRLADINSKLEIAINNYHHLEKSFEELKQDFWDHMKLNHKEK